MCLVGSEQDEWINTRLSVWLSSRKNYWKAAERVGNVKELENLIYISIVEAIAILNKTA